MASCSDVEFCNWAYEGRLDLVKTALEQNEGLLAKVDSSGRTGLHWACSSGKANIVGVLITKGAKVFQ